MRALPLLLALCAVLLQGAVAHGQDAVVPPSQDPFYQPPADLAARPNGAVIRTRAVASAVPTATATQVQYRSTDAKGAPVAAVSTLLTPALPWNGEGPRPLVSYQIGYDALGPQCNPSYTLRTGDEDDLAIILMLLQAGYAVAAPDFEGPANAFGAGPLAAHTVLDGVRAMHQLPAESGLAGPATPTVLFGYSGGGQASAWAAEEAPIYAPELRLRGVAAGGLAPDLLEVVRTTDGTTAAGVGLATLLGVERQYPELAITPRLNEAGRQLAAEIGGQCREDFDDGYPGRRLADLLVDASEDPLSRFRPRVVFENNRLGRETPPMPMYLFHSAADEEVPVRGPDALATAWCRNGATVLYQRDNDSSHSTYQHLATMPAFAWLAERLAGSPAPSNCGTTPAAELARFCPTGASVKFRLDRIRGQRVRYVTLLQEGKLIGRERGRSVRNIIVRRLVPGTYTFTVTRVTRDYRRVNRYRRPIVCKRRVV